VKRKTLTKEDIQLQLQAEIRKDRKLATLLTILVAHGIPGYICLAIAYINGSLTAGHRWAPASLLLLPIVFVCMIVFLLNVYYIDLYRAKAGKFQILEEQLCQRMKETNLYYRQVRNESTLYFRCGRVAVTEEVYEYSREGDRFYVVIVRPRKAPRLVYHTKYYKIDTEQK